MQYIIPTKKAISPEIISTKKAISSEGLFQKTQTIEVPNYVMAFMAMTNGDWINLNDDTDENCKDNFVGNNVNLSLICALMLTTFVPLYFTEAARLDSIDDGLTIDISLGFLSTHLKTLKLSKEGLHDFFDVCYLIAVLGTLLGTILSVFYMIAANECRVDARAYVLIKYLGKIRLATPFYYWVIGIVAWGTSASLQMILVVRTRQAFIIKLFLYSLLIGTFAAGCLPFIVQGIYLAKKEEIEHPAMFVSDEEIDGKLSRFFADPSGEHDLTLKEFLHHLSKFTDKGYRIPLNLVSKVRATKKYYMKLADVTDTSVQDVKEYLNVE